MPAPTLRGSGGVKISDVAEDGRIGQAQYRAPQLTRLGSVCSEKLVYDMSFHTDKINARLGLYDSL